MDHTRTVKCLPIDLSIKQDLLLDAEVDPPMNINYITVNI